MKVLARELLWFFIAIILSAPLAYVFSYIMSLDPADITLTMEEEVFQMELFIVGGILGFIGTYLVRIIIWAVYKHLISDT